MVLGAAGCHGLVGPQSEESGPGGGSQGPGCDVPAVALAPAQHLTSAEYARTVTDLLGAQPVDIVLAADEQAGGFDVGTGISELLVDQYVGTAEELARVAVAQDLGRLIPCALASPDRACAEEFVDKFGRRAFRRPLTDEERQAYGAVFDVGNEYDFASGIEAVLFAMLSSPQFLYHVETPSVPTAAPGETVALESYALASRLSYFIWGTMPDATLFEAAATGALEGPRLEATARQMMRDPRAIEGLHAFARQWLELDGLEGLARDPGMFPGFDAQTATRFRTSIEDFVEEGFRGANPTLGTLFLSPAVFADAELGALLGLPIGPGAGSQRIETDSNRRRGLITQPALLAMFAKPQQTDPIHRGIFVRERLLCQSLQPPPADLVVTLPEIAPGVSTRERFAQHADDPACARCHRLIDPIGFGFEHYDAVGRWRDHESGVPIDASGEVVGTQDADGPFRGAVELAERLARSDQATSCVASQWFRYAIGRLETPADACSSGQAKKEFIESGYNLEELMLAIVRTDAFRYFNVPEGATYEL